MASKVNRRRFVRTAAAAVASGAAAVALSAQAAEDPPLLPPLDPSLEGKPAAKTDPQPVCCTPAAKPIFTCSGAADVGQIADHAARKLTVDGVGKMSCLAGIGGRVKGIMEIAKSATTILVIDGCPLHCGRNTMENAGFTKFEHVCLADLGMEKGKTPATDEAVAKVVSRGKVRLGRLK
jgi:uncharacterized metal-binding protein